MAEAEEPARPAFYALAPGGWRDYVTLLHPPYTAWHLSYAALGAGLAPHVDPTRLVATLGAFLLAVGVAAHCLDELRGRPLGTQIPAGVLRALAVGGLGCAVGLGLIGLRQVGWPLAVLIVVGVVACVAYNLELAGGRLHSDAAFALTWGGFPVITGYVAQTGRIGLGTVAGALFAVLGSLGQRRLSAFARGLRRGRIRVAGTIADAAGERRLDAVGLAAHADDALSLLAGAHVLLAVAVVAVRA